MPQVARAAVTFLTNLTAKIAAQIGAAPIPAANLTGSNTLPAGVLPKNIASAAQARSGAGAVDPTAARTTKLTTTAAAQSVTLSTNGPYAGARHTLSAYAGYNMTNTTVLTASGTTFAGFTSATFTAIGQALELEWDGAAWFVVANTGTTLA